MQSQRCKNKPVRCHGNQLNGLRVSASQSSGFVLPVVVFIMLIVGIASLVSIERSVIEYKRSTQNRDAITEENDAEEILLSVENQVRQLESEDGIEAQLTTANTAFFDYRTINEIEVIPWGSISYPSGSPANGTSTRYVVQYLGERPKIGESVADRPTGETVTNQGRYYRVITESREGNSARRQYKSIFRFEKPSDS